MSRATTSRRTRSAQPWQGHRWMNIMRQGARPVPADRTAYLPHALHALRGCALPHRRRRRLHSAPTALSSSIRSRPGAPGDRSRACPYGAIYWNEEKGLAQKCTGCAHLLEAGWAETRCSQVCPTEALRARAGPTEAERIEAARAAAEGLERIPPGLSSAQGQRVFYKNLHRWDEGVRRLRAWSSATATSAPPAPQ